MADDLEQVPKTMSDSNLYEDKLNYSDRLSQIKATVDDGNKALLELSNHLKYIKENENALKKFDHSDPSINYVPLHHSKHKEFVESVVLLVDLMRNWDQHVAQHEARSLPKLKAAIQHLEMCVKRNGTELKGLEDNILELQSFYDSSNHLSKSSGSSKSM